MLDFSLWKRVLIFGALLLGIVYAAPNVLPYGFSDSASGLARFIPGRQLNLGLDLQGGAHLLLEVESAAIYTERLQTLSEDVRTVLRDKRIRFRNLRVDSESVTFTLRSADDVEVLVLALPRLQEGIVVERVDELGFRLSYPPALLADLQDNAVERSLEIIRRRVDEFGTREPLIQRQGQNRIIVQVAGAKDPERLKNTIGKTARLTFHLLNSRFASGATVPETAPPGSLLLPSRDGGMMVVEKRVRVAGDDLVDSAPAFENNNPVVSFRFNASGARKFGQATQENVGRNLAIILDNEVVSAPSIREPILGGSGIISGNFTVAEAQDLAILLSAGALPAPIKVLEERTVGASLGQDSIAAGKLASVVAVVAVIGLVLFFYGIYGLFANIALLLNLVLITGLLSALQATLTLPGIAGIVLTIGMAVDANVLVFERIREEYNKGRETVHAISEGYKRAIATIADSNLTTLIAGVLLFAFGSGPIKGFAVTLSLGIVASLFTAIMVTRLMIAIHYRRSASKTLPI